MILRLLTALICYLPSFFHSAIQYLTSLRWKMTFNEMTSTKLFRSCEDLYRRTTKYHEKHADYNVQILHFAVLQVAEKPLVNKYHGEHADYNL